LNVEKSKLTIIIAFIATALAMATITTTIRSQSVLAATKSSSTGQQTFTATMTGSEEVPPKNTQATGSAKFISSSDENSMIYRIRVANINGVTMAHIHSGKTGKNGPIVVTLFKSATQTGPINGLLSQGTITSTNLEGPLKGKTISDLVKLINDGKAYANVHTQQNPKGEIRGQISTSAAASASTSADNTDSSSTATANSKNTNPNSINCQSKKGSTNTAAFGTLKYAGGKCTGQNGVSVAAGGVKSNSGSVGIHGTRGPNGNSHFGDIRK
jgi:CHRD domain